MLLLPRKLLDQGFLVVKLKSSHRKFCGRQHDLVIRYGISVSQMTTDIFHFSQPQSRPFFPYFVTYRRVCTTTCATSGKLQTLPEHLSLPYGFSVVRVNFLYSVLQIIIFFAWSFFFLAIGVSLRRLFTVSECVFGVFKHL